MNKGTPWALDLKTTGSIMEVKECCGIATVLFNSAGTGEHASLNGMNIGSIRHASDIKTENITPQSQGILTEQTGI